MATFTEALEALKAGRPVLRAAWSNTCYLIIEHGQALRRRREWHPQFAPKVQGNVIQMCAPHTPHAVAWQPNQLDLLAEDWIIR